MMKGIRSLILTLLAAFFAASALLAASAASAHTGNCGKDPKQMCEEEFSELYLSEGGA